ncbi:MAG TPA: hypothetical protein VFU37_18455 [Pyrinomonadaceae bacterium]|nr:hypothetical protein [Pyrinomonadaceae bacterium]
MSSSKQGLPVVGHVPLSVTSVEAAEAGQKSIEHLGSIRSHVREHTACITIVQWVPTARSYRLTIDDHSGRLLFFDSDVWAESIEEVQQIADVLTQEAAPHDCRCEGRMRFIP